MKYIDYIEMVAGKRFSQPCVKGTRITVYDVLNWLANGMEKNEIVQDFPELSIEAIETCLAYAANRERNIISPN